MDWPTIKTSKMQLPLHSTQKELSMLEFIENHYWSLWILCLITILCVTAMACSGDK